MSHVSPLGLSAYATNYENVGNTWWRIITWDKIYFPYKKRGSDLKKGKDEREKYRQGNSEIEKTYILLGPSLKELTIKSYPIIFHSLGASFSFLFTRNLLCHFFRNTCYMIFHIITSDASKIYYTTFPSTFLFSHTNPSTFTIVLFYTKNFNFRHFMSSKQEN